MMSGLSGRNSDGVERDEVCQRAPMVTTKTWAELDNGTTRRSSEDVAGREMEIYLCVLLFYLRLDES